MKFSISTLAAASALLAFVVISPPLARADTVTTFDASGIFQGGANLSGTLTIDIATGSVISSAMEVASDSFSGFDVTSNSSETTLTSAGGPPTMFLQLPVSTLMGYTGGSLGSFAHPVIVNGLHDYSSIHFGSNIAIYLASGSLTPASTVPEISTWLMAAMGLLLIGLALRRRAKFANKAKHQLVWWPTDLIAYARSMNGCIVQDSRN
ncbi:MAG: hypothetical protein ACRD4Q_05800 [Candidatus Acidiferrales bacterium]